MFKIPAKSSRLMSALLAAPLAALCAAPVSAADANYENEYAPHMEMYMTLTVANWVADATVLDAIRAQNAKTSGLSEAEIIALDDEWRASDETGALQRGVLETAPSDFLRDMVAASDGMVSEVFVTDAVGLNVAASVATSDYWQGDEDKFSMTYSVGVDAIHIGDMEVDASTGAYQGQASMTITDPDTGAPIGSVTVGLLPDLF